MGRHKTHLKVEGHRLYSNSSNKEVLILNRHSALDLSRNLVQNSRRRCNELSPQQKKALEDFRKNKILDFEHHDGYSRVEVLKAYFHFFDEMFFGSLRRWVELRYCYRKVGEVAVGGRTESLLKEERLLGMLKGKKQRVRLTIYLMENEHRSRRRALAEYRGTLLHEMIHAFLFCWACNYDDCYVAWSGHGSIWQDVAYSLESAARDRGFLHLDVWLRRENALAMEVHKSGRWPGKTDLARWNIAENDFLDSYQAIKNIGGVTAAKNIIQNGGVKRRSW